jgi:transposase
MLDMNEYRTIRGMHALGASIKLIARDLHMARNTVRKYLKSDEPPEFHAPSVRNPTLAPFDEKVKEMLKKYFIGSRILQELRKVGYSGPQATFYRHLARLRKTTQVPEVVQRFETAPAHQAQYDWSEYVILSACAPVKVYVSCLILGYSRYRHYHASLDITQPSIFEAIEAGFTAFHGVPKEVLFDNPRALVTHARPHLAWNSSLLALAGHYGFLPRACWPYRAQTKGKVENPFRYLETQFIIGLTWNGFGDFAARLKAFEQEVNQRPHGTTGVPPQERLAEEQPLLTPLPDHPFISPACDFRHVSMDSFIPFQKKRYSVPWQYAGKTVWVKVCSGAELEIYSQSGDLLARHTLERGPRRVIIDHEHYAGLHERHQLQKTLLAEAFKARFPDSGLFLAKLLAQYKFNATEQLRRILSLAEYYASDVMKAAFEQALAHNTFSVNFVRGILEQLTGEDPQKESPTMPHQMRLPGLDLKPDLNRYQQLIDRPKGRKVSNG